MNKTLFTIVLLTVFSLSCVAKPKELSKEIQQQVIEKTKEYCALLQEFSGDVEKVENLEMITELCENSNVSVFDDLSDASNRDFSQNSMPLYQYMMMVTDRFMHSVQTSYSGFQYVKSIEQPSTLPEFKAASYAFVKVVKQVKTPDFSSKQRLNIIVNTATMKVSSTISQDYEDPQSIYLEGLEKFNEEKYTEAMPLFEKAGSVQRYAGRFRAQTMTGWCCVKMRDYQKANDLLRQSSQSDPLGGVVLASEVLMREDVPVTLRNYTEGLDILQRLGDTRSSDFPIHLIAKSAILDALLDSKNNGQRVNAKVIKLDGDVFEQLLTDPQTVDAFRVRGYIGKAMEALFEKKDLEETKKNIDQAALLLKSCTLDKEKFELMDMWVYTLKANLFSQSSNQEAMNALVQEYMVKPYALRVTADGCVTANSNIEQVFEYYRKAAELDDAYSAYIVSLGYFPIHESMPLWEHLWLKNTFNMKDSRTVKGWTDFLRLLLESPNKSAEEFLRWNQKAIDLGDVNAMEDRAICLVNEGSPCPKTDIAQGLTLACRAACVGLRSDSYKLFDVNAGALYLEKDVPFESSETYKTLKSLSDQGNGAASYLLACDLEKTNPELARQYLEKGKDAFCFYAMHDYACRLEKEGKYDEAFDLFNRTTIFPRSYAYSQMGDIERDQRHNDVAAMKYYQLGRKDNDYGCAEAISDMLKEGRLGNLKLKTDNFSAAKSYIRLAQSQYKSYSGTYELGDDDNDENLKRMKAKEATLDSLIALGGNTDAGAATPIARLNTILDASQGEDERIVLSESLLAELFASPQAVVMTVGTNGQTVVAKETAEDFLLRIATMQTEKKLVEISSKKDSEGKYTELTVELK